MKKYIISLLIVFVLSGSTFAGNKNFSTDKATNNYLYALDSDKSSLVESAIFNVMALQKHYPESDYDAITNKLTDLSLNSDNPAVRYKAFLALNYFNNTEWFGDYDFIRQENHDIIFDDIARKMDIRSKIKFINTKK